MSLAGKTVVVTGAASGIGAATAAECARQGARVIAVDRTPVDGFDESFQSDLGDPQSIDTLVGGLPDGVDGLANIAGVPPTAPPGEVLRVNLLGLRHLTIALIPKLADGASIVNLISSAFRGWRDATDEIRELLATDWDTLDDFVEGRDLASHGRSYFLSKEALLVWTMQNRWTWNERGIRMNGVSPGPVDTPILPDFLETLGPKGQQSLQAMDRLGTPQDVAPVVAFLLSDATTWFRGANLTPDGGLTSYFALRDAGLT